MNQQINEENLTTLLYTPFNQGFHIIPTDEFSAIVNSIQKYTKSDIFFEKPKKPASGFIPKSKIASEDNCTVAASIKFGLPVASAEASASSMCYILQNYIYMDDGELKSYSEISDKETPSNLGQFCTSLVWAIGYRITVYYSQMDLKAGVSLGSLASSASASGKNLNVNLSIAGVASLPFPTGITNGSGALTPEAIGRIGAWRDNFDQLLAAITSAKTEEHFDEIKKRYGIRQIDPAIIGVKFNHAIEDYYDIEASKDDIYRSSTLFAFWRMKHKDSFETVKKHFDKYDFGGRIDLNIVNNWYKYFATINNSKTEDYEKDIPALMEKKFTYFDRVQNFKEK